MGKLIVGEFISLDGVVEAPETWHFPYQNDEMFAAMWSMTAKADTLLLGRVTYQGFAGAFAHAPADDPVATHMNRPTKVVVSSTLQDLEWTNSRLLTGDPIEQTAKLKEASGSDIAVTGSIRLVRTLLAGGLVDELHLLQHPIVVGTGERLFATGAARIPMELTRSATFSTGVVHLVYRPA
jgi:dihydrofolate reductase